MHARHDNSAHRRAAIAALIVAFMGTGCTSVAPWERGRLAKPQSAIEPEPMQRNLRTHVYSSREGTPGGSPAQGGGCGCY